MHRAILQTIDRALSPPAPAPEFPGVTSRTPRSPRQRRNRHASVARATRGVRNWAQIRRTAVELSAETERCNSSLTPVFSKSGREAALPGDQGFLAPLGMTGQ